MWHMLLRLVAFCSCVIDMIALRTHACRYMSFPRYYAYIMCAAAFSHNIFEYFLFWISYTADNGATVPKTVGLVFVFYVIPNFPIGTDLLVSTTSS
jgi:hypothetical protein